MKMFEKVKQFVGFNDDFYDDDDDYMEDSKDTRESRDGRREDTNTKGRLIKVHTNTDTKVYICEPRKYEECTKAVDEVKNRKIVVLNIEELDIELQKQIFEFIKGAVYALEAGIQKISNGIFVLAPNNVKIDGKISNKYENKTATIFENMFNQ